MRGMGSESSTDSSESQFSHIRLPGDKKPTGVGSDDVDPFAINKKMGRSEKPIRGMYASPEDIHDIHKQRGKKRGDSTSSSSNDRHPQADYDPINPFGRGNDPDPDHFRPPK